MPDKANISEGKALDAAVFGVRLSYLDSHPKASSKALSKMETLVFLHGWCSTHESFKEQLSHFSDQYRCIALDLPGHGRSAKPRLDYTVVVMGELIVGFLEKLGLRDVILVGHGIGACVALETARQKPAFVKGMAFINPGPMAKSANGISELSAMQARLDQQDFRSSIRDVIKDAFPDANDHRHFAEWAESALMQVPDYVGLSCFEDLLSWSGRPALKSVRDKPLGLILTEAPFDPVEEFERLNDDFSWGRTMDRSAYGHLITPEETNALLGSWIRRAVRP